MWPFCSKGFDRKKQPARENWIWPQPIVVEQQLNCTLEELCYGGEKRVKAKRLVYDKLGEFSCTQEEDEIVSIPPGSCHGDRIVFPRKRDEISCLMFEEITFVLVEKPHAMFKRIGHGLWIRKKITLVEALTEETLKLETLDKRYLTIANREPCCDLVVITNEGMPIHPYSEIRGSLYFKFDIVFPKNLNLTNVDKDKLKKLLSVEEPSSDEHKKVDV